MADDRVSDLEEEPQNSTADSGVGDLKPERSHCHLLLLCNQVLKKRCKSIAASIRSGGQKYSLHCTLKCITYIEEANAFSVSQKTEPLLQSASLVLCIIRVERVQEFALQQLLQFAPQRAQESLALLQCVGDDFVVQHADSRCSTQRDADPAFVNFFLRCWLAETLSCRPPPQQLTFVSIDNNKEKSQVLQHRLLSRRYTLDVEYQPRRRSLYRPSASASPVRARRWQSLGDCLDVVEKEDAVLEQEVGELSGKQLVLCHSRACRKEANLMLNHLASRGAAATTLTAFLAASAASGRRQSLQRLRQRLAPHRSLLAKALRCRQAADAVFLLLCRSESSRLLAALAEARRLRQTQPSACFVVLTSPTVAPQLQLLEDSAVEVFYSAQGLAGIQLLRQLMPSLLQLVRRLALPGTA